MKGFVPTPPAVVDHMIDKLFADGPPSASSTVLDPGAGRGAFVDGLIRWCDSRGIGLPRIAAVEADPQHAAFLKARYARNQQIRVVEADYLDGRLPGFDYIIGNPPYVAITGLSEVERARYRERYVTARGRFDLYMLFFERSLQLLNRGGTLVFITPEKFLYVDTAAPLRGLLGRGELREFEFADEETFPGFVTYPLISTIRNAKAAASVTVAYRDGTRRTVRWAKTQSSWLPMLRQEQELPDGPVLADICERISCGIATGADSVFVVPREHMDPRLDTFALPTIAGRDIVGVDLPPLHSVMLTPYDENGELIPEAKLGALGEYLNEPARKAALLARTCVLRKPWYAFHESPPLAELLCPKILCKDIGAKPTFVVDSDGVILPRHSVYYLIPRGGVDLQSLADYLNSAAVRNWLDANCQRASKGFLRVQSQVLKRLPVPFDLVPLPQQLSLDADTTILRSA